MTMKTANWVLIALGALSLIAIYTRLLVLDADVRIVQMQLQRQQQQHEQRVWMRSIPAGERK